MFSRALLTTMVASMLAVPAANAAFTSPTGWTRPTGPSEALATNTTYQLWDVFVTPAGPNAPDVAAINPWGTSNAFDSNFPASGAFVTSGGNLYSFGGVIRPRVVVPQPDLGTNSYTNVLLQLRVSGQVINVSGVTAGGIPAEQLPNYQYQLLSSQALGGAFGGFLEEHAWSFTVPGNASSLTLDLDFGVSSAALDRLSVDTFAAIPEPAAMVGLFALMPMLARRRP